jgi:rhamnulokinase
MKPRHFLAVDLGAESGRVILGTIESERLAVRELYRFPNGPVQLLGHLHWNLPALFEEIKKGARVCVQEAGVQPESVAVDTWGVDFGLVAEDGSLLGLPYAYRDPRTLGVMDEFFKLMPREEVYGLTGIQFMNFNSLFQLAAMVRDRSPLLEAASGLLFMPDLFHYLLTGRRSSELTIATTSQLYNPRKKTWSRELFAALGLPDSLMQDISRPGTVLGPLTAEVAEATGLSRETTVIATATHDTASAVAAVPAQGRDWAYISSGTWSLMGIESPEPIINSRTLKLNFTNEGGIEGRTRFLKNVTGLWLLQQCRRKWQGGSAEGPSYGELVRAAEESPGFRTLIDPDAPGFLNPPDMPGAIQEYARQTGQPEPDSRASFVRCILESLALKYRRVLDQLREVSPQPIARIHVIGGGSQNSLLCRFTAEATGLPVVAGPAEATASGNILVQALALGVVRSPEEIRTVMRNSTSLDTYEPQSPKAWEQAYDRFRSLPGIV